MVMIMVVVVMVAVIGAIGGVGGSGGGCGSCDDEDDSDSDEHKARCINNYTKFLPGVVLGSISVFRYNHQKTPKKGKIN